MTRDDILRKLQRAFRAYLGVSSTAAGRLVPSTVSSGKLYEAHVLSLVVQRLVEDEGFKLTLVGGPKIKLKSAPGPINRGYPHIEMSRDGAVAAEIWTDVEFLSLSRSLRSGPQTKGDYHELDIVVIEPGQTGRPPHNTVWLGIECKNTAGYEKSLLKEILGIRRELSLLRDGASTQFRKWPRRLVPADPPSCLLVYATAESVNDYAEPGKVFGIDFVHEPM
jgi:hypothetical protein